MRATIERREVVEFDASEDLNLAKVNGIEVADERNGCFGRTGFDGSIGPGPSGHPLEPQSGLEAVEEAADGDRRAHAGAE